MKKNILVVDDSALLRRTMCDIINSSNIFQATDVCRDGQEAYEKLKTTRYDGVVLDVNMPRMTGLELLEKLQQDNIKVTVIMVSTETTKDAEVTMLAMEYGAVDFITKPTNIIEAKGESFKEKLLGVLTAVIATEYIKKNPVLIPNKLVGGLMARKKPEFRNRKLVALACSTGGPKALQSVIPFLEAGMDAPMVLVQHMPAGFTKSMADRLNELSKITVKEATDKELLQKGTVYVAPGGKHMKIVKTNDGGHRIVLTDEPAIGGLKPCANLMYESLKDSDFDDFLALVSKPT